jgi:integrase
VSYLPVSISGSTPITHRIGLADDSQPANGTTVLSYEQAVREAEKWNAHTTGVVLINKAYTVRNLAEDYFADQERVKRKKLIKNRLRVETNVLPVLGEVPLRKLTHHQVENWLHDLAKSLPRAKTKNGEVAYREVADVDNEEYLRRRQASANSTWNLFRALLNFGYQNGKVASKTAWDRVKSFKAVNEPKVVEITSDQLQAIVDACDPVFQPFAKAALYTGARVGELRRMRVKDFNPKTSKVFLPKTKNGISRYVYLNDQALEMFLGITAGRDPDEVIFLKNGAPWGDNHQTIPMHKAVDSAAVTRRFSFHQLRHQCACICLENGMTMKEVSEMLGHKSVAITERFYARFSKDHMHDKVQRCAPRLRSAAPTSDPNNAARVIAFPAVKAAS